MKKEIAFELGGIRFKGESLELEPSLKTFGILAPVIDQILQKVDVTKFGGELSESDKLGLFRDLVSGALCGMTSLNQLAEPFYSVYKVNRADFSEFEDAFVPLKPMKDTLFRGAPVLHVGWLVAALHAEYGDFLDETSGAPVLTSLAKLFGWQKE